jgi:hypothetical protein
MWVNDSKQTLTGVSNRLPMDRLGPVQKFTGTYGATPPIVSNLHTSSLFCSGEQTGAQ